LKSKAGDDKVKGESLDDAKYKHQFEARNDYNGGVPPLKNHYPQPPPEPVSIAGRGSLTQKAEKDDKKEKPENLDDAKYKN